MVLTKAFKYPPRDRRATWQGSYMCSGQLVNLERMSGVQCCPGIGAPFRRRIAAVHKCETHIHLECAIPCYSHLNQKFRHAGPSTTNPNAYPMAASHLLRPLKHALLHEGFLYLYAQSPSTRRAGRLPARYFYVPYCHILADGKGAALTRVAWQLNGRDCRLCDLSSAHFRAI
jgi:hypothetical protein